jgi:hypothetical protein
MNSGCPPAFGRPDFSPAAACGRSTRRRLRLAAWTLVIAWLLIVAAPAGFAQTRRSAPKPGPKPREVTRTEPADISCNATLGSGVRTGRTFCDVLSGRDASGGILVRLPKRTGPATLYFDLHNRHTYSAEQEKAGRAYTRYTATVGVLTLDNTLLTRAVIQSEFRREADLFDRIAASGGTSGVKAVAPTGVESIALDIPAEIDGVSILGEKLATSRLDGDALYTAAGRPVAVISQVVVEYKPPPPAPPARPTRRRR